MSRRRAATHQRLRVMSIDPATLKSRPLADFVLADGEVRATFYTEAYSAEVSRFGIADASGHHTWPPTTKSAAKAWMQALWVTYSASSFRYVEPAPTLGRRVRKAQRGTQPPASDLHERASTPGRATSAARARRRKAR